MFTSGIMLASTNLSTENLSILQPVSPAGESIRHLFVLLLAITGSIFLLVEFILFLSVFRFHSTRKLSSNKEPAQVYGSTPIEIAWTAAPTLVVFLMVLVIVRTELVVEPTIPKPKLDDQSLYVTVIGHQWWWEYVYETYDGEKLTNLITANELHIPVSDANNRRPTYLKLQSADVCHSFWVPRLAGKMDLIPGRTNYLVLSSDSEGLFLGQCAEFCGTQHGNMLLRVNVETPENFNAWLNEQQKKAVDSPKESGGKAIFLKQTCVNCHRIRGTQANGSYAPDLTHLGSRETIGSGMRALTRTELREWIRNPQKLKDGCLMAPFSGLGNQELDALTDYLMSLK